MLTNSMSCLPFSYTTTNFNGKLTLSYARVLNSWSSFLQLGEHDVNQKYMKMTKDAILEGSSQQANKDFINKRNGQSPKHFEVLLISLLKMSPKPN